jgi:hypothetical protein
MGFFIFGIVALAVILTMPAAKKTEEPVKEIMVYKSNI